MHRSFNEGSPSSVTSTKLGQPLISSFCKHGNTSPDHFFHPCKPSINNSFSDGSCPSVGIDVHLLQPLIDTCFKLRNEGSPIQFGNSSPPYDLILSFINSS
ncbi:hypothetical protein Hanom_Chr04g00294461 [Helianthus anomalus]